MKNRAKRTSAREGGRAVAVGEEGGRVALSASTSTSRSTPRCHRRSLLLLLLLLLLSSSSPPPLSPRLLLLLLLPKLLRRPTWRRDVSSTFCFFSIFKSRTNEKGKKTNASPPVDGEREHGEEKNERKKKVKSISRGRLDHSLFFFFFFSTLSPPPPVLLRKNADRSRPTCPRRRDAGTTITGCSTDLAPTFQGPLPPPIRGVLFFCSFSLKRAKKKKETKRICRRRRRRKKKEKKEKKRAQCGCLQQRKTTLELPALDELFPWKTSRGHPAPCCVRGGRV